MRFEHIAEQLPETIGKTRSLPDRRRGPCGRKVGGRHRIPADRGLNVPVLRKITGAGGRQPIGSSADSSPYFSHNARAPEAARYTGNYDSERKNTPAARPRSDRRRASRLRAAVRSDGRRRVRVRALAGHAPRSAHLAPKPSARAYWRGAARIASLDRCGRIPPSRRRRSGYFAAIRRYSRWTDGRRACLPPLIPLMPPRYRKCSRSPIDRTRTRPPVDGLAASLPHARPNRDVRPTWRNSPGTPASGRSGPLPMDRWPPISPLRWPAR